MLSIRKYKFNVFSYINQNEILRFPDDDTYCFNCDDMSSLKYCDKVQTCAKDDEVMTVK